MTTSLPEKLTQALSDRYRIEGELGAGGMATVYLAEDVKHRRQVALKVLRDDLSASLGAERFLREISIAAGLTHPHILPLHDSGEAGGRLFYVMPYVDGQSLRQKLRKEGELPIGEAVRVLRDVADAMAHAHERSVVHRDLKPENIMLSGRHALVTDFGVAKALSEATGRQTLTTAGVALGTPSYMSPEQATGDPHADHRSDIYSFGVLAYELLTGQTPFGGRSPQEVLAAHVTSPVVPVTSHRATIPPPLAALVMQCLEKKPADRPQSAEQLMPVLETLLTPSGGMTPTGTAPYAVGAAGTGRALWRNRPVVLFGSVGFAVAVAVAGWQFLRAPSGGRVPNRVAVAWFENRTGAAALSDAGVSTAEWLIDALSREGKIEVVPAAYVRELTTGTLAKSPSPASALAAATRSHLLITGSVSRRGDSLEYRAELLNAEAQKVLASFGPFRGGTNDTYPLDSLQDRTVVAVLEFLGVRAQGAEGMPPWSRPRTLAAFREQSAAWEAFSRSDFLKVLEHTAVVRRLEPDFVGGYQTASSAMFNLGRLTEGDSLLAIAESMRARLTEADITWIAWLRAWYTGDKEAEFRAAESQAVRYPGTGNYEAAVSAARSGRFSAALKYIAKRDTTFWGRNWRAWDDVHASALHQLGRFSEEEAAVRNNIRRRELGLTTVGPLARALAAQGRLDAVDSLYDLVKDMPSSGASSPVGMLGTAAWEFLAHGGGDSVARALLQRRLGYFLALPAPEQARSYRAIAQTRLLFGQVAQARETLDSLARADPKNVADLGWSGVAAALQSDSTAVRTADSRLESLKLPYLLGWNFVWRSRIAAVAGDCAAAERHLRSALSAGYRLNDVTLHQWAAFGKSRSCKTLLTVIAPRD